MVKGPNDVPVEGAPAGGTDSSSSSSLLLRVQAREAEAWQRLVRLYGPVVYSWCRRAGLQEADATDVGQEVFLAIARGIDTFRRDRPGDSFRGWLFGITRNKLGDYRRRSARRPEAMGGPAAQQLLAQAPAQERAAEPDETGPGTTGRLLRRALDLVHLQFAERTWQAFWRVTVEGQAPADVAAALGMSSNAVHIAKSRVLHRLRQEFGELIG